VDTGWTIFKSNLYAGFYEVPVAKELDSGTTYQWHIRACNPGPKCVESDIWSFTTKGEAPAEYRDLKAGVWSAQIRRMGRYR